MTLSVSSTVLVYDTLLCLFAPLLHYTPSFSKIRITYSSRRSFVILFGTPAISIHSRCEYYSSLCVFLSVLMTLSFNFLWLMERFVEVFSGTIFQIIKFGFDEIKFSRNSLLSFTNSVCFDISLSCSFIAKSISCSLVIFSNCFVVRMLLPPIFILLTISHSALEVKAS